MANFIPPVNGASQGNYFQAKIPKMALRNRETDRQTYSLTPYTGGCVFFLSLKFATSLLALLAGDKNEIF